MEDNWAEELARYQGRVARRQRLLKRQGDQRQRCSELEAACEQLRRACVLEDADVERLRGMSFQSLLRGFLGDKKERLEQEEREALEARTRYRDGCAELQRRSQELVALEQEAEQLGGASADLQELLDHRAQTLQERGGPLASDLGQLGERGGNLRAERDEVQEARLAGSAASEEMDEALEVLDRAAALGVYDVLGGGLFMTHFKHAKLDEARECLEHARDALWDFANELHHVDEFDGPELAIDQLQVLLDYFCDGLLFDFLMQRRITAARDRVGQTLNEVETILAALDRRHADLGRELTAIDDRWRALIESA